MSETSEIGRLLGEVKEFRDEFRVRLADIDILMRIAEAADESVLAKVIRAADRRRIGIWRDNAAEDLRSIAAIGTVYEMKQQDPYILPEFTPEVFHHANERAGELLQELIGQSEGA